MKYIIIANNNNRIGVMQLSYKNLRYFDRSIKLTSRQKHYDYRGYSARNYNDNEKFLSKSLKKSKIS